MDWADEGLRKAVLFDLKELTKDRRALFIKIDPEVRLQSETGEQPDVMPLGARVLAELEATDWRFSTDQIQFRNTFLLDLNPSEEHLLMGMKQKTRYNIRLARKRGVEIRPGNSSDIDRIYRLYAETSLRNGFAIRSRQYYTDVWGDFIDAGVAYPLLAEVEGELVAGLILYVYGRTAWYLYGMSGDQHREKMPNHLLQWEAIRLAKQLGSETYDFWGAPDTSDPGDRMWGVHRFKEGFGASLVQTLGAWDFPGRPFFYHVYTRGLPPLLSLMRFLGRRQTRSALADLSPSILED